MSAIHTYIRRPHGKTNRSRTGHSLSVIKLLCMNLVLLFHTITVAHPTHINQENYSIVFVYLGNKLPHYLEHSMHQARLFNKNCNLFLLLNDTAINKNISLLKKIERYEPIIVTCESLKKSTIHDEFDRICLQRSMYDYWKFTTERFFCIHELMEQYKLKDVFQIECDVMLYVNLNEYIGIFKNYQINIACPFQNDYLASMSFIYFNNTCAIQRFTDFIVHKFHGQSVECDMYLLASYKNEIIDSKVEYLPTITQDYIKRSILKNRRGETAAQPWKYWTHIEEWNSIFDNDSIGTFLNGGDWKFFNQTFFDFSIYDFKWEKDTEHRRIPYIYLHDKNTDYKYRINTLHIASKNLEKFLSI